MAGTAVASTHAPAAATTNPKVPKAEKPAGVGAKKPRSPRAYPSFYEMVSVAIAALKERNGSSQYALTKFIEEKHKNLPPNFRKLLLLQLKRLVASGKLVKVKNSFKLPAVKKAPGSKPKDTAKPSSEARERKAKANATVRPKPKAATKPAKAAKTATTTSPGRKVAKPKKAAPVKSVKKPKAVKSPAKKAKK